MPRVIDSNGNIKTANTSVTAQNLVVISKLADQSVTSSITLVNDNDLTYTVQASSTYHFRFRLFVNNVGTVEGFKVALNGTATAANLISQVLAASDAALTVTDIGRITALNTGLAVISSGSGLAIVEIDGTIATTAGGTFALQFAQNTSGGNAVTVQKGSTLELELVNVSLVGQSTIGPFRVASDVTNATATMAAITGLTAPLLSGYKYTGELILKCSNSTAAEGIAIDFDGGNATMNSFAAGAGLLTGGTTVSTVTTSSALATDLNWTTITGETWFVIKFSMACNVGGTLIPRFCEGTAHTSGTATISTGSYMWIEGTP